MAGCALRSIRRGNGAEVGACRCSRWQGKRRCVACINVCATRMNPPARPLVAVRRSPQWAPTERTPARCTRGMRSSTSADRGHSGTQCPADHVAGVCPEAHRRLDPLLVPAVLVHQRLRLRRSRLPRVLVPLTPFPLKPRAALLISDAHRSLHSAREQNCRCRRRPKRERTA